MQQSGVRHPPPHLARLNTAGGVSPGGLYSPAMMQTPLAYNTPPFIPNAPKRPGHRSNQPSMQFIPQTPATPGMGGHYPRPSMLGGGSFNFTGDSNQPQGWQQKRKNRQVSIGGPPKAVLGGPQRKMSVSPLPAEVDKVKAKLEEDRAKLRKKANVKLPKETLTEDEREPWARYPMPLPSSDDVIRDLREDELSTGIPFPDEVYKYEIPTTVEVFLPGKDTWKKLKHRAIEEKLDKLGIIAGSGSTTASNTLWGHGRAASISSPADPALLLSKLRKLQSSQLADGSTDAGGSSIGTSSPAPPSIMSFGHAHSQSLATNPFGHHAILGNDGAAPFIHAPQGRAPPTLHTDRLTPDSTGSSLLAPPPVSAVGNRPSSKPDFMRGFGLDLEEVEEVDETGHSRQNSANLLQTESWVKAHSRQQSGKDAEGSPEPGEKLPSWAFSHNRINSTRADEEERATLASGQVPLSPYLHPTESSIRTSTVTPVGYPTDLPPLPSGIGRESGSPASGKDLHARHVSKLSAALSLRSVGGLSAELEESRKAIASQRVEKDDNGEADMSIEVDERLEEWTGTDDEEEVESLGEYSNPSDEERARQDRVTRRRTRAHSIALSRTPTGHHEDPRQLPDFPNPPDLNFSLPFDRTQRMAAEDDEWRSNPSDDEAPPTRDFLGVALGGTGGLAFSEFNFHSRENSNKSAHDPANAHSRIHSGNSDLQSGHQPRPSFAAPKPALNPFARPFKFGALAQKEVETPAWFKDKFNPGPPPIEVSIQPPRPAVIAQPPSLSTVGAPPNAPIISGHARLPSFGRPLNIAAAEFKPNFGSGLGLASPSLQTPTASTFNIAAPVFKPSGNLPMFNAKAPEFKPSFTFRPPSNAPPMPAGPPPPKSLPRYVPDPEPDAFTGVDQQHREKRLRRSADLEDPIEVPPVVVTKDGKESLSSFKFPYGTNDLSPLKVRNAAASPSPSVEDSGVGNEPFSLSTFQKNSVNGMPQVPKTPTDPEHQSQDRRTSLTMAMAMAHNQGDESEDEDVYEGADSISEVESPSDHVPLARLFPMHQVTQSLVDSGALNLAAAPSVVPTKQRRAPIPLDFKRTQPERKSTIPAGLFKSLVNGSNGGQNLGIRSPSRGEDRTRRAVRSRLSSRDVFEMEHARNPSLDDLNVPGISLSHKASRGRLVTDPLGPSPIPRNDRDEDDVFNTSAVQGHAKRRSSLPDGIGNGTHRPIVVDDEDDYRSDESGSEFLAEGVSNTLAAKLGVQQMERRLNEMGQLERRLEDLLDEKIAKIIGMDGVGRAALEPATEERITEVLSLFRTQLQESAAKSLAGYEDSHADARAEIDFELIRDMVREGHDDAREVMQEELNSLIQRLAEVQVSAAAASSGQTQDFAPLIEQLNSHTLHAVETAINNSVQRLHDVTHHSAARTQETIIENITEALDPIVRHARADPVDYDLLTNKLSMAVRPTLSDMLDLASDKRETADLIIQQLMPILSNLSTPAQPAFDPEELTQRITSFVRQAVAALDPFELKDQVADLVVERLDSRLSVRDKSFNAEVLSNKVLTNVTVLLEPIWGQFAALKSTHEDLAAQHSDTSLGQSQLTNLITALPAQVQLALDEFRVASESVIAASSVTRSGGDAITVKDPLLEANLTHIRAAVDTLIGGQKSLSTHTDSILSVHHEVLDRLITLPDAISHTNGLLQGAHAELDLARDTHKREMDDLRRNNTQLQVDLAKARGAHGQIRVEKDGLAEKVRGIEIDRERLQVELKDTETAAARRNEEIESADARNKDLEAALQVALNRLQSSDVSTQANSDRIAELERTNRELASEKNALKAKVDSTELQATFAQRDKDSALQSLAILQKQHDTLTAQQSHWDTLAETKQQVSMLTELLTHAETNDVAELKRFKEHALIAESEHAALQKRFKDQESKISNSEKIAFTARQTLAAANQRASEWEKRARDYQGELEMMQTKLEQTEQTHGQLDADYSVAKLELDSRNSAMSLVEDRERRTKEQISTLEGKVRNLQSALTKAQQAPPTAPYTNGTSRPARPDSRSSTVYIDSRSVTPTGGVPSPKPTVWDSMHAPVSVRDSGYSSISGRGTHHIVSHSPVPSRYPGLGVANSRRPTQSVYSRAPSPTASVATVDEDGWWS